MTNHIKECQEKVRELILKNNSDLSRIMMRNEANVNLILTNSCNLSCPFCYQPKEIRNSNVMSRGIADKAMLFLSREYEAKSLIVNLFGGEPFVNKDLAIYLVEKYPMFRFLATTNGLLLLENEELRNWVKKNRGNLTISFSMGALKQRFQSSELIDKTSPILEVVKNNKGDVHYVVDDPFDSFVLKHVRYLLDMGIENLRFSLPKESDKVINYKNEYIELFKKIVDICYPVKNPNLKLNLDVYCKTNIYKQVHGDTKFNFQSSFCGASFSYLAIDYKGDIYPCDYFSAYPEWKLGDIYKGLDSKNRIFEKLPGWENNIYKDCQDCVLGDVRLCPNAMCFAENFRYNKDVFKPTKTICFIREIELATYKYISEVMMEEEKTNAESPVSLQSC